MAAGIHGVISGPVGGAVADHFPRRRLHPGRGRAAARHRLLSDRGCGGVEGGLLGGGRSADQDRRGVLSSCGDGVHPESGAGSAAQLRQRHEQLLPDGQHDGGPSPSWCVVAPARRTAAVRRRWRDVPAVVAQRGVRLPQKLPETPPSWRSLLAAVAPGCTTSGTAQGCATWCCPSPSSTSSPRRWPCCCQSCSIAPRPASGLVRLPDGSHGSWQSGGHDHRRHRAHRWRDEAGVEHRHLFAMAGATTPSFFLAANAISGLGNGVIPPRRTPARAGVQRHDDHHGRHRAAGHGLAGVLADAVDQNVSLLFAAAGVATARMATIMTCNRSFRAFLSTRLGVAVGGQLRARPPPCRTATAATEWATSRFLRPEMRELPVATPRTIAQTPSP